jgi:hypothetical protein
MSKNARWSQKTEGALSIVLAAGNPKAAELFGGKTLRAVGEALDLSDDDVRWGYGMNPKTKEKIKSLLVTHDGITYQIPLSRGMVDYDVTSPEKMLNCVFRTGFLSVKEDDGVTPARDEQGNIALDASKPYISFGKPGISIDRTESVFNEPVVEGNVKVDDLVTSGD